MPQTWPKNTARSQIPRTTVKTQDKPSSFFKLYYGLTTRIFFSYNKQLYQEPPTRAVLPTKTTHQDVRGLEKKNPRI